jgi:hypothetical protein
MSPNGPQDSRRGAGVDHASDGVVPQVLLERRPVGVDVARRGGSACRRRVGPDQVVGVAAADARRLHAAARGEIGRAEGDALHARAGGRDLVDVRDSRGGLEDRVDEDRPVEPGLGFELREDPVDVVDVLDALDLRHHDDVELVADLRDEGEQVVQDPGRVEAVDAGPQLAAGEVGRSADPHQAVAGGLLAVGLDGVLEVAEQNVDLADQLRDLGGHPLVARVEEVDHPRRAERDLAQRRRGAQGQRLEEGLGAAHDSPSGR